MDQQESITVKTRKDKFPEKKVDPLAVDEHAAAQIVGMSVAWLRKDRRTKKQIPFFRLGGAVRYNPDRIREALDAIAEGGAPKRRGPR